MDDERGVCFIRQRLHFLDHLFAPLQAFELSSHEVSLFSMIVIGGVKGLAWRVQ
ncbi:hypothetical protein [Acidovorax sp. SUPP3334]|uniref:hypothetical protein n=1 Tax=Acidovorax sp. SUPP3334 TaxID=2920881 RepID=UPI0023DE40A0|nr:hypothetical protein [Acidovorax sp. SUPP3334]GKT26929.1 hypothetical protein AVHM3334_22440 [Acidovorax sp. SUPP3334]